MAKNTNIKFKQGGFECVIKRFCVITGQVCDMLVSRMQSLPTQLNFLGVEVLNCNKKKDEKNPSVAREKK